MKKQKNKQIIEKDNPNKKKYEELDSCNSIASLKTFIRNWL